MNCFDPSGAINGYGALSCFIADRFEFADAHGLLLVIRPSLASVGSHKHICVSDQFGRSWVAQRANPDLFEDAVEHIFFQYLFESFANDLA